MALGGWSWNRYANPPTDIYGPWPVQALILLASHREKSQTRILSNTRSLLFFGVFHRGFSPVATFYLSFLYLVLNFLGFFLVSDLVTGSGGEFIPSRKELRTMLEAFAPISDRFQIYTFCDAIATRTWWASIIGFGDSVNYFMGLPNEELLHINANYSKMIKFSSPHSANYKKVLAILRRIPRQTGLTPHNRDDQLFRLDTQER